MICFWPRYWLLSAPPPPTLIRLTRQCETSNLVMLCTEIFVRRSQCVHRIADVGVFICLINIQISYMNKSTKKNKIANYYLAALPWWVGMLKPRDGRLSKFKEIIFFKSLDTNIDIIRSQVFAHVEFNPMDLIIGLK